jgi:hypothetical protein
MQAITMRLVRDYHELGTAFDSALIAYLSEQEHDLDGKCVSVCVFE